MSVHQQHHLSLLADGEPCTAARSIAGEAVELTANGPSGENVSRANLGPRGSTPHQRRAEVGAEAHYITTVFHRFLEFTALDIADE